MSYLSPLSLLSGLCLSLLSLSACTSQYKHALTAKAHEAMAQETQAFLQRMPKGLQDRQNAAIVKAMQGDVSDLQRVRSSRNTLPTLDSGVSFRTLSPTLRLYETHHHDREPLPLLIYLHGGGWTFGSLNSCAAFCSAMAASGQIKVLAVDYRLAPEHPFPQGLNDCIAAVDYAHSHAQELGIDPSRVSIGGDSSGGNLAIATALSPECLGKLSAMLLFYPVTKAYDDASSSWAAYGKGYGLDAKIMNTFNRAYLFRANTTPQDVRISVGLSDKKRLQQLPRTLLIAAGRDILCNQGKAFAQRAGKKVQRILFPQATHLFITVPGQKTAFTSAVHLSSEFLLKH